MTLEKQIDNLAKVIVKEGVHVKKNDYVYISASVECYEFVRKLTQYAYDLGAKKVTVFYGDQKKAKMDYIHQSEETLKAVPKWSIESREEIVKNKGCYISIVSDDPEGLKGTDPKKLARVMKHNRLLTKKFSAASMNNAIKWCVCANATPAWAKKVFPKDPVDVATNKLWKLIIKASYADKDDGKTWAKHTAQIQKRCEKLNKMDIKTLVYKSKNGTDFTFDLPKGYMFLGGKEKALWGEPFSANIPTEEVFVSPDYRTGNGKLVASMPLCASGNVIEGMWFELKDGRIVKYGAKKNFETLKGLVEADEGAHYLGEASFVEYDSPIQSFKTLFYNTLFDENAACHFAFGKGYYTLKKHGLSPKETKKAGINESAIHVDFMIGTRDLSIKAITHKGKEITIFKNGNFAF